MKRVLSDSEVRNILLEEPEDIGLNLIIIEESIVSQTDFQLSKGDQDTEFRLVEDWVKNIQRVHEETNNFTERLRTEQIDDGEIEKNIYGIQEDLVKTIIQEYNEAVKKEVSGFSGKGELFAGRNYMSDAGFNHVRANLVDYLLEDEEMVKISEEHSEIRITPLDLAKAYAELLIEYKDNVSKDVMGEKLSFYKEDP